MRVCGLFSVLLVLAPLAVQSQSGAWSGMAGSSVRQCREAPFDLAFRVIRDGGDSLFYLSWELPPDFQGELTADVVVPSQDEDPLNARRIAFYQGLSTPMRHVGFISREKRLRVETARFSMGHGYCTYLPFSISTATNANNNWDTVVRMTPDPRQLYLDYTTPADIDIQMADPMPGGYPPTFLHLDRWYLSRKDGRIRQGGWWFKQRTVRWLVDEAQLMEIEPDRYYAAEGEEQPGRAWIRQRRLSKSAAMDLHAFRSGG